MNIQLVTSVNFRVVDIINALQIDFKNSRVISNTLKNDKIIKIGVKSMPSSANSEICLKTNIYWLDYVGIINSTRFKLDQIQDKIFQQEKGLNTSLFYCKKCSKRFSDLDISNIFDPLLNIFK